MTCPANHCSALDKEGEGATRAHWRSATTITDEDGEGLERTGGERRAALPPLEPSVTSVKIAVHQCLETARCADAESQRWRHRAERLEPHLNEVSSFEVQSSWFHDTL